MLSLFCFMSVYPLNVHSLYLLLLSPSICPHNLTCFFAENTPDAMFSNIGPGPEPKTTQQMCVPCIRWVFCERSRSVLFLIAKPWKHRIFLSVVYTLQTIEPLKIDLKHKKTATSQMCCFTDVLWPVLSGMSHWLQWERFNCGWPTFKTQICYGSSVVSIATRSVCL